MVFSADQEDAHHLPRADGAAGEEPQANAVQQAAVAPVLRMEVLFLTLQLAFLTQTLHVKKVRVNLQRIAHLRHGSSKNYILNPSTPELNPSAQRCLTKIFYWGF
jgi:hypothetical protein